MYADRQQLCKAVLRLSLTSVAFFVFVLVELAYKEPLLQLTIQTIPEQ